MNAFEQALARAFKIPPQPQAPRGSGESVRIFRAAKPFFAYLLVQWLLAQGGSVVGILFGLQFVDRAPIGFWTPWLHFFEWFGIGVYLLLIPITLVGVALEYKLRWYIVTDRSLRIREGVFRVRERTMSFANIQNLSIRRGPLQQLLGIADVEVRSAGGGESGAADKSDRHEDLHRGLFRGVENAEAIRDLILGRQRQLRDAGLGDPDDLASPAADSEPSDRGLERGLIEAARHLVREASALRREVDGSPSGGAAGDGAARAG